MNSDSTRCSNGSPSSYRASYREGLSPFVCSCSMFPLFALALKLYTMALAVAHAWCEHHQEPLGVRGLGGPEGFTMGDGLRHRLHILRIKLDRKSSNPWIYL